MQTARKGSYSGGKGTLIVDERASGGKLMEFPTLTCQHCNMIVVLNNLRTRPRGHCTRCSRYICDDCMKLGECNYVEEMIDLALAHPGEGPFLLRGPGGVPLYDTKLRDAKRLH